MRTVIALSVAAVAQASVKVGTIHDGSAPVLGSLNVDSIPDAYIIKFKDHVDESAASAHHSWVQDIHGDGEQARLELRKRDLNDVEAFGGVKHTFKIGKSFRGYAGHFHEDIVEQVRNHPDVEFIERDSIVRTMVPVDHKCDGETQKTSPWGLARVSGRNKLTFSNYNKYVHAAAAGEGVDAYVIDTGINVGHNDFDGRATWHVTIPKGAMDDDGNGHGTHCAGTVAGTKFGVAKKTNVFAIKVLGDNGSGSMSDVLMGVQAAATAHREQVERAKAGKRNGFKGSLASMSLGGGSSKALDYAVNAAVDSGLHMAVAAGNDNDDACNSSPAAAEKPITVGASTISDVRAYFSNYGKCVDVFGPGMNIQSAWIGSKDATNVISGTSMATPHVAGIVATLLSFQPAFDSDFSAAPITAKKLKADLLKIATKNALSDIPEDTPNLLIFNGGGCSNYTEIVEAGGFTVKKGKATTKPFSIKELEEAIEGDFQVVSGKVVSGAKKIGAKAEDLADKIREIVEEEVEEILSEISQ